MLSVQKSECETRADSQFVMCRNEMMRNVDVNVYVNGQMVKWSNGHLIIVVILTMTILITSNSCLVTRAYEVLYSQNGLHHHFRRYLEKGRSTLPHSYSYPCVGEFIHSLVYPNIQQSAFYFILSYLILSYL